MGSRKTWGCIIGEMGRGVGKLWHWRKKHKRYIEQHTQLLEALGLMKKIRNRMKYCMLPFT